MASEWKPIETAPKDRDILLLSTAGIRYVGRFNFTSEHYGDLWEVSCCESYESCTMWCEIPPLTEEEP